MPVKYLRRWHYSHYFGGESQIHLPPEMTKEEVEVELNVKLGKGNWRSDSLKRGGLVKEKKTRSR